MNNNLLMESSEKNNRIRFTNMDTILCRTETDYDFLNDIREIAEKKKASENQEFFQSKKQYITDAELDDIHNKAIYHASANIINQNNIINEQQSKLNGIMQGDIKQLCFCGCKKELGPSLPIFASEQKIASLGPGVILLFFYLRHLRQLVFLCFLVFGAFSSISNVTVDNQEYEQMCLGQEGLAKQYCIGSVLSSFLPSRNNKIIIFCQFFLGFIMVIVWVIGTRILKKLGELKDQQTDYVLESASDYAIKIDNLPYGNYSEDQLLEYLKHIWEQADKDSQQNNRPQSFSIKGIQIIYNMQNCRKLIEGMSKLSIQLIECLERSQYKFSNIIKEDQLMKYRRVKAEFLEKLLKLEDMRNQFLGSSETRKNFATSCAILQFPSNQDQSYFLKILAAQKNPLQNVLLPNPNTQFKNQSLSFSRSPQPSDILWLNCEKKFSFYRSAIIWGVTMLILYLGYTIISFVQTLQIFKSVHHVVITITLQLLNRGIWFWLTIIITFEQNNTKTQAIISSMKKSVIAQSLNIIVNPIISKFVNDKALYGSTGLAGMALTYQIVMLGMMMIYYIFNPFYLGKTFIIKVKCLRNMLIRYLCRVVGHIDTAEEIKPVLVFYQGPQLPVAGAYVYMSTAIFHAMFYCHLQPLILLVVTCNMTFFFLIMKYMLYHRCKILQLTNNNIFHIAIFFANFGAVYYAVGSIFFYLIDEDREQLNVVTIIFSVLCLVFWLLSNLDVCGVFSKTTFFLIQLIKKYASHSKTKTKTPKISQSHVQFKDFKRTYSVKIQDIEFEQPGKTKFHEENAAAQEKISQDQSQTSNHKVLNYKEQVMKQNLLNSNYTEELQFMSWKRRQSYYTDSNTNALLQFETILKQMKDDCIYKRGDQLRKFCERFGFTQPIRKTPSMIEDPIQMSLEYKKRVVFQQGNNDLIIRNKSDTQSESPVKFTIIPVIKIERKAKKIKQRKSGHDYSKNR